MLHSRNSLLRKKNFIFSREPASEIHEFLLTDVVSLGKIIFISRLALARKLGILAADSYSRSDYEWSIEICRAKTTVLFDSQVDWLGNTVKAEVILRQIDFSKQCAF